MGIISRLGYGRLILVFAVFSVSVLCAQQLALASPEPVQITLTHPSKPSIKIKVDKAYLRSTFLALVRKNLKGGKHKMAMIDISYPSMKPINSEEIKPEQWKSIVFISNSNDNFVSNYFNRRIGERFKLDKGNKNINGEIKKYILIEKTGMHPSMIKLWSDDVFYYYDGNRVKYNNHLIECQYTLISNSNCSGFLQLKSGIMIQYYIPLSKITEWKEIYLRFHEFALMLESKGE